MPSGRHRKHVPHEREERWFELYAETRRELSGMPGVPQDYDPLAIMAQISMMDGQDGREQVGPALRFLAAKEVASYTRARMPSASGNGDAKLLPSPADPSGASIVRY